MSDKDDPLMLALQYFPPGWHFVPQHPSKSLKFYNKVLTTTESIQIKPIFDRVDKTKVIYHSLYIKRILRWEQWGAHPSSQIPLPGTEEVYNYHDYIEAWLKILCYQNETFSHSWFIQFDQKFKYALPFPNWFNRWWEQYGPISEIIPEPLRDFIPHFQKKSFTAQDSSMPPLLLFISKFKIPWIVKWQYHLIKNPVTSQTFHSSGNSQALVRTHGQYDIVTRQTFVKWWDKFDQYRIISQIQKEFPEDQSPSPIAHKPILSFTVPHPTLSSNKESTSETKIEPMSPKPEPKNKQKISPTPSIETLDLSKCSKSQLKMLLAQALSNQIEEDSDNEDSPTSDQQSVSNSSRREIQVSNKEYFDRQLFQDAQDPFN